MSRGLCKGGTIVFQHKGAKFSAGAALPKPTEVHQVGVSVIGAVRSLTPTSAASTLWYLIAPGDYVTINCPLPRFRMSQTRWHTPFGPR